MTQPPRILSLFGGVVLFGQERGNIEALLAMKEQGCEILCLIRDEEWIELIPKTLDMHGLAWRKVPFLRVWKGKAHASDIIGNACDALRANIAFLRIVRQFRPTHIHAFNQLNVLTFLPGLCLTRIPLVYRAGDRPTVHHWLWRVSWSFIVFRTMRFVSISRFIRQSLTDHAVKPERISIICNRPPTRRQALHPPMLPEGHVWVIYVGQIIPEKGVGLFIDAVRHLAPLHPNLGALVLGRISDWSGDGWARNLRDSIAGDVILAKRVFFAGEVEDVDSYLKCATVHVAPSLIMEALGNVVLEAKLAGIPSIVFPSGGLPEMITRDVDGHVCEEPTAQSLAAAIARYLDDPALAVAHGKAARRSLADLGTESFPMKWMAVLAGGDVK